MLGVWAIYRQCFRCTVRLIKHLGNLDKDLVNDTIQMYKIQALMVKIRVEGYWKIQ